SGDCLSRWKVRRVAVFRPIPGSLASSAARSSIADTTVSEWKLEGQRESAGQLLHFLLRQLRRLLLRFTHGDKYQVLQHFHVRWIHHCGIDLHGAHLSLSVGSHRHHPSTTGGRHGASLELLLHLLELALHLLGLLQHLHEISHRGVSTFGWAVNVQAIGLRSPTASTPFSRAIPGPAHPPRYRAMGRACAALPGAR